MKVNKVYYAIQQANRAADVYIFGDIVKYEWFEGDVSAAGIVNQIKDLDVDEINVYIDSYGGAVSEGWAIYDALIRHPARINTYGMGFVASAALYPFLAGDSRYASSLSAYYFHEVMIEAAGYAEDLRAAADEAEMLTDIGISAFTERTRMTAEEVRELMAKETWLSPAVALEYGLATAITADTAPRYAQNAKKKVMQMLTAEPAVLKEPEPIPNEIEPKEPEPEKNKILQLFERS